LDEVAGIKEGFRQQNGGDDRALPTAAMKADFQHDSSPSHRSLNVLIQQTGVSPRLAGWKACPTLLLNT
jgi:hypothetical protein